MPAWFTWIAIKEGVSRFWPFILVILVLIVIAAIYLSGRDAGKEQSAVVIKSIKGQLQATQEKAAADANAAEAQLSDAERLANESRQLEEVIDHAPDPNAARRSYYRCLRVQQRARAAGDPAPACR